MKDFDINDDSRFEPCPVCKGPARYTNLGGVMCVDRKSECPVRPVVLGGDESLERKWTELCRLVRIGKQGGLQ